MIIAVVGPTGVGKTKMSIELAKKYNAIVINADAVQIYKYLNIGSAKIKEEEKEGIPHYLFDIKEPSEQYTVKDYQDNLREILEKYKDKNIVLVGGTGLYLCAGLMDYRFTEDESSEDYENYTNEELYKMAKQKDDSIDIHPNNRVRLVRFLNKKPVDKVDPKLLYDNVYFIGLTTERNNLYEIIDNRVDTMMSQGLLEEVKTLYQKYPDSRILHSAIGYKELVEYLENKVTLEDAVYNIKQNSRHYAKRQYTWFNNKMNVKWFDTNYDNFNKTIEEVKSYIDAR